MRCGDGHGSEPKVGNAASARRDLDAAFADGIERLHWIAGGCLASVFSLRLNAVEFWTRAINALDFADIMQGMMKPLVYGFILATVGCYKGLTVRGGTQGVGRATTQAVVVASVMIIGADLFLTKLALYLGDKIF